METLMDALLEWTGSNTDHPVTDVPPPEIVPMDPRALTVEAYSDVPQLLPEDGVDERVRALYNAELRRIYVLDPRHVGGWDEHEEAFSNPAWREILLHELIHHVQWSTGVADLWPCKAFGEKEAYLLGGRYLKERSVTDPLPNRNFWAHAYARC